MSKGRNVTFNAVMDEELLDGMYEQVLLGRKADRGFKGEAYEAVAAAMTANSNGEYVLTKQSIVNRCKYHKKNYSIATELLNASGFGYDNTTKRIIAADDVWTAWIEGHPDAKPYRAKVIDYDKLTQIFGADVATGQYARSATTAPSRASCESDSRYYNPSQADSDVGLTDQIHGFRIASSGGEGSSKRKNNRKRSSEMLEIISCIERSGEGLKAAIHDVADSLRMPKKKAVDMIMVELKQIAELNGLDMSLAHEWLTIHGNMATVFLSTDEKRDWILRQLPKIKSELIG